MELSYVLIVSIVIPFLEFLSDMFYNSFDCWFSEKTLEKLRVKDNSFLRKIIPIKEKYLVNKDGVTYSYRYFLVIRAVPLLVYTIILIIMLPIAIVNCFIKFIPDIIMLIISGILLGYYIIHELVISICSQLLHL